MKLRKGSKLTLRNDLINGALYGYTYYFDDMPKGKVIVKKVDRNLCSQPLIQLENDSPNNWYSLEMFQEFYTEDLF